MTAKDFDSQKFAQSMKDQAAGVMPSDLNESQKKYVQDLIHWNSVVAGHVLAQDKNISLDEDQASIIVQFIAEWTFHKAIDLFRAGITEDLCTSILQEVCLSIYEKAKYLITNNFDENKIKAAVEIEVSYSFEKVLKEMAKKGKIKEEDIPDMLKQSNIDTMAEQPEKPKKKKTAKIPIPLLNALAILLIIFFLISGIFIVFVSINLILFIISYFHQHPIHIVKLLIYTVLGFTGICATLSYLIKKDVMNQIKKLEEIKAKMLKLVNPDTMYERIKTDTLGLEVGLGLITIADPEQEGQLLAKTAALRQILTDKLGYIIPNIRIRDNTSFKNNEYQIFVRENVVAEGTVYPDRLMVIADQWNATGKSLPTGSIQDFHPIGKKEVYWIKQSDSLDNVTLTRPDDILVAHIRESCIKYVHDILSFNDVTKLMEHARKQNPACVDNLTACNLSIVALQKILANLIKEKISIKDITFIFERLCDFVRFTDDPDKLSERLRAALGRQICLGHSTEDKILYTITLSSDWEKTLESSCQRTELGTMFLLNPLQIKDLIELSTHTLMRAHQSVEVQPVILCSPGIRLPLYRLLEIHIPTVVVISYSELIPDIKVEMLDKINCSLSNTQE